MVYKFNKNLICKALMVILIILGISLPCSLMAQVDEDISGENYPQIKDIPIIKSGGGRKFSQEVELLYDFIGRIDSVNNEGITVDDSYFKKAPSAKASGLSEGKRVGLLLNKAGEFVLCEPVKQSLK